jgi:hypothetical protein
MLLQFVLSLIAVSIAAGAMAVDDAADGVLWGLALRVATICVATTVVTLVGNIGSEQVSWKPVAVGVAVGAAVAWLANRDLIAQPDWDAGEGDVEESLRWLPVLCTSPLCVRACARIAATASCALTRVPSCARAQVASSRRACGARTVAARRSSLAAGTSACDGASSSPCRPLVSLSCCRRSCGCAGDCMAHVSRSPRDLTPTVAYVRTRVRLHLPATGRQVHVQWPAWVVVC